LEKLQDERKSRSANLDHKVPKKDEVKQESQRVTPPAHPFPAAAALVPGAEQTQTQTTKKTKQKTH
jgi:hypothetical protein